MLIGVLISVPYVFPLRPLCHLSLTQVALSLGYGEVRPHTTMYPAYPYVCCVASFMCSGLALLSDLSSGLEETQTAGMYIIHVFHRTHHRLTNKRHSCA
jgi:hypothetical protein